MSSRYDNMHREGLLEEVMILRAFLLNAAPRHWVETQDLKSATEWEKEAISVLHLESMSED